jgi:hypothetical protein
MDSKEGIPTTMEKEAMPTTMHPKEAIPTTTQKEATPTTMHPTEALAGLPAAATLVARAVAAAMGRQ